MSYISIYKCEKKTEVNRRAISISALKHLFDKVLAFTGEIYVLSISGAKNTV